MSSGPASTDASEAGYIWRSPILIPKAETPLQRRGSPYIQSNRRGCRCVITGFAHAAAGATSRGGHRRCAGRLVVLCAAYFSGYVLDTPKLMELPSGRGHGQLTLRSTADPASVHRQYWLPSHSPSGAAHSELSAACGVRSESATAVCTSFDPSDEPRVRTFEALGRGARMHGGAGRRKVRWPTSVSHVATSNDHPWHLVPTLGRFAAEGAL